MDLRAIGRTATTTALALVLALALSACSDGGGSPTSPAPSNPAPTPPPAFNSGTLSGTVTSAAGGGIGGAIIRIVDGPRAGTTAGTDNDGRYQFTGLPQMGFSVEVTHPNYVSASRGFTVSPQTPSVTGNFSLLPAQLWSRRGAANDVFEIPGYVTRVRVYGFWDGRGTSNFIVRLNGSSIVNAILRERNPYEGVHLVGSGSKTIQIISSENITDWRFTEER
jgi:hypothetical protein